MSVLGTLKQAGPALFVMIVAYVLSSALTRRLAAWRASGWMDHPNQRSLHSQPTPRNGGLAIVFGLLVGVSLLWLGASYDSRMGILLLCVVPISVIAVIDDWVGLSVRLRLGAQLVCAAMLLMLLGDLPTPQWPAEQLWLPGDTIAIGSTDAGHPAVRGAIDAVTPLDTGAHLLQYLWIGLLYLFVVWMTNLYNFMDGMDGFAAGMAVIGFGTLAVLGALSAEALFAGWCTSVTGAAGGFLRHNFPPARIFMGDVGSITLGFLASGTLLWAASIGVCPLWAGVLVFSPFVVDATLTLFQRALRGERIWEAHRSHHYQRLAQCGWGHRKTVLWAYGLMVLCALAAVVALHVRSEAMPAFVELLVVLISALVYICIAFFVRIRAPMHVCTGPVSIGDR